MHDPMTVAFEIKNPFSRKEYRDSIITIWHVDPEKDGTDDSCGWFIRLRHADKDVYEKIVKEFEYQWDRVFESEGGTPYRYSCGWFHPEGIPNLSVQGIVFNMYLWAAKIALAKDDRKPRQNWDIAWKFLRKNLVEIIYFAENTTDSMFDTITRKFQIGTNTPYDAERRKEMIRNCASIIYTDILRKTRPWYRHPRWHIHHWKIQFHLWQRFRRRWFDKCCKCGKRGFRGSAISDWGGKLIWHPECEE